MYVSFTFLFIEYSLTVISFATNVANTVAKYVSFTNKYSNADLCQNIYRQVFAAMTET